MTDTGSTAQPYFYLLEPMEVTKYHSARACDVQKHQLSEFHQTLRVYSDPAPSKHIKMIYIVTV